MAKQTRKTVSVRGELTQTRRAQQFMVRAEADDAVTESLRKMRLSKVAAVSSLYLWFARQSPAIQQLVAGVLPDQYAADAAKEFASWAKDEYPAFRQDVEDLLLS